MKILFRIIAIIFSVCVLWVLLQNIDYTVTVNVFEQTFEETKLPLVLLVSFAAGLIIGSILMTLIALQYKAEVIKQRKREKNLMSELDSLRNLSIDEIVIDELEIDQNQAVELPLIEKNKEEND